VFFAQICQSATTIVFDIGYIWDPDMSIEVPNFIPVSILVRKISQKYTVCRRPTKN
jgi:hypothetical protein